MVYKHHNLRLLLVESPGLVVLQDLQLHSRTQQPRIRDLHKCRVPRLHLANIRTSSLQRLSNQPWLPTTLLLTWTSISCQTTSRRTGRTGLPSSILALDEFWMLT